MFIVEVFLPLRDNAGKAFSKSQFENVQTTLSQRFGGVTAYARAPAVGFWEDQSGDVHHDDIVVFEVMTEQFDSNWWASYRRTLEAQLKQQEVLIRCFGAERI